MSYHEREMPRKDFGPLGLFVGRLASYYESGSFEDARIRIGERLEKIQKGEPYQRDDRFIVFDEDGKTQVVDVVGVIKDSDARDGTLDLISRTWGSEEDQRTFSISTQEADKFCRGNRLVLTASLFDVQKALSDTTLSIPSDTLRFVHALQPGQDLIEEAKRRGIELQDEFVIDHSLSQAIACFYHDNSPDYGSLLKALEQITAYQQKAVSSVRGKERSVRIVPSGQAEQGHFVMRPITPDEQAPLYRMLIDRYEKRVNTTERAMLQVLNLMQEETGSVPYVMEWQETPEA